MSAGIFDGGLIDPAALAELRQSESQLRQVLSLLPAAVYTCDTRGIITWFNEAAAQLWGREPAIGVDAWCGSFRIFYADGSPMPPDACPMAVALREGRPVRGEEIIIARPDGTRRNVLPFPTPTRDGAGNVSGAVNMLVDVTDNRQSELDRAALRARLADDSATKSRADREMLENEERLRLATQTGKVGLWEWDIDGNRVLWTDSLYAMHGVTPETFDGTIEGFSKLVHAEDLETVQQAIKRTIEEGAPYELEFRIVRPDGTVVWLFTNARVIRENARPMRMLGATMDITARKATEAALTEAKESAEAANRSKDRFLAVLSHELRTPLTPVLMSVAAMQMDPELSPAMRENVTMIRRNVELETKLIDDLLDLSRVTSGKLRLVPQAVDVNDVVTHVCGICQSQIFEKGIQLTCDLANDAGCVTADPARLQQVLWNVLKNAAKFTPQGGKIDVSTRRRGDRGAGDRVAIVVRDNGAGIAQSMLPRVFDAFEQGDVRVTRQFGGLGLGLAISKALVELHTGTIRAESNGEGCGSTFTIELPSRVSALKPRPEPREATGNSKPAGARLLVVEDHPDTAMLLGKLLRAAGYDVRTSLSAAGALSMASSEPFDLLISDIGLPDATGYELMQQLRERSGIDGKVLGIAMSGYGMDEDIKRSQEAGFSEHLVKPIDVAQLEDAIRRILEVPASAS